MPCLPGYSKDHHKRLQDVCFSSLAPGTWKNKTIHFACYSAFMAKHTVSPLKPSVYDVMSFLIHLKDTLRSTAAIVNYFWGARSAVECRSGSTAPFDSPQVTLLRKGLPRTTQHTPLQAPPTYSRIAKSGHRLYNPHTTFP